MFKITTVFLDEVGLSDIPEDQKQAFLDHLQEELEVRIGEYVSEGMTDEQIDEFEDIIDGDEEAINKVLATLGDYKSDVAYKMLVEQGGFTDGSPELLSEFASIKWLTKNRPDYQDVVKRAIESLKEELRRDRDEILAAAKAA
jgi:hypothetical protein